MASLTISQVAKQVGLRTSAIRYYEQIGLVDATERMGGQRRYDTSVFYRLSIVQRTQQAGSPWKRSMNYLPVLCPEPLRRSDGSSCPQEN